MGRVVKAVAGGGRGVGVEWCVCVHVCVCSVSGIMQHIIHDGVLVFVCGGGGKV